jgi:hypothetical protein
MNNNGWSDWVGVAMAVGMVSLLVLVWLTTG